MKRKAKINSANFGPYKQIQFDVLLRIDVKVMY